MILISHTDEGRKMPELKPPGVYARYPELFEVVPRDAKPEKVIGNLGVAAGLVHGRTGSMMYADSKADRIYRWSGDAKWKTSKAEGEKSPDVSGAPTGKAPSELFRERAGGVSGMTLDHQGRLLNCESSSGRVTRTEKDGSVTVLAGQFNGARLVGPHDLIYAIDGSVYFTDGGVASTVENGRAVKSPAVYQITRTQIPGASRLLKISEDYERPAGVTLGPKQNLLYVSDAARKNIRVHEIRSDGSLAPGRVFAELDANEPGEVGGLETDEKGHVYAAGPGGLWVFSGAGRHLGTIVFAESPTHCCWGAGFSGLYVSAGSSVYHVGSRVAGTRTF